MKKDPLIIVNPKSGKGTTEQQWASLTGRLHSYLGAFDFRFTKGRADATRIAEEEARRGRKLIIAAGGDGTFSEVANGIIKSRADTALAILPRGTGGDFRMTLGLPPGLKEICERIKNGTTREMDVGLLNYVNREGAPAQRFFINTASFGLSGIVADRANASAKRLGGTVTYVAATMSTLFSYSPPEILLEIDEKPSARLRVVTVCVANGPSFGGGMKIAPGAKINDGLFNVIVIGDLSTSKILFNSYKLYTGTFLKMQQVSNIPATKVKVTPIDASAEILLEVDGESPGRLPASFEIAPRALRIRS